MEAIEGNLDKGFVFEKMQNPFFLKNNL